MVKQQLGGGGGKGLNPKVLLQTIPPFDNSLGTFGLMSPDKDQAELMKRTSSTKDNSDTFLSLRPGLLLS